MSNLLDYYESRRYYWHAMFHMQYYIEEENFEEAMFYYLNVLFYSDEFINNYFNLTEEEKIYIECL